jgi:hypothetical protein
MNNEWSDDEEEVVLDQPNRDMPISSEEEEEEEYDMEEIRNLTLKTQNTMWNDIVKKDTHIITKPLSNKLVKKEPVIEKIYEKRKFNPRLPPPTKHKSHNNIIFNNTEFPKLK